MSIQSNIEEANHNSELAMELIDDTLSTLTKIVKLSNKEDEDKIRKRMNEPKPKHFSDEQWNRWKELSLEILKH